MKIQVVNYRLKKFDELKLEELYTILALRQDIFIVEQDCPYLDADGNDQVSWHVMGVNENNSLLSYTRIVPKGISYQDYVSIGRVVVHKKARGTGEGFRLMEASIEASKKLYPSSKIKISAQSHLNKFYGKLGFESTGEEYLEDGIPHMAMILKV